MALRKKIIPLIIFLVSFSHLMAECSDLDSLQCIQYPEYCDWDQNLDQCQEIALDTLSFNYDCIPYNDITPIPTSTTEYAEMCIDYVGLPPSVDCGDGVPIPVYVDGISMNVDQPQGECDHPDFKGGCFVGSRVGRVQGIDLDGEPMPEVIWVYFCRSAGQDYFNEHGIVSVQMIGYNIENGATCYFESPDAIGDNIQSEYLSNAGSR